MDARAAPARLDDYCDGTTDACPCCTRTIPYFEQFRIHRPSRVVMRRGCAAVLTPRELRILLAIMETRTELTRHSLVERVYAHDPQGGPENAMTSVSVGLYRLKHKLAALDVEIKNYALVYAVHDHRMTASADWYG